MLRSTHHRSTTLLWRHRYEDTAEGGKVGRKEKKGRGGRMEGGWKEKSGGGGGDEGKRRR